MSSGVFCVDFGQIIQKTDPGGLADIFDYSNRQLTSTSIDPNGNSFIYEYDSHQRLISKIGTSTSLNYQYVSHPYGVRNISSYDGSSVSYEYDSLGRIQTVTTSVDGFTNSVSYQYDDNNRITKITAPNA